MENIKLAIFDVAGTTAKDEGLVVKAFVSAAISQGVVCNSDRLNQMIRYVEETMGQRKMDVFLHLFENNQVVAEAAHNRFVAAYLELVASGELEEFEGITPFFKELRNKGIGIAITTGFPREILDLIIKNLNWGELIDVSVAASEVENGRPSPDMIFRSMELFSKSTGIAVSADQIAVIGDTVSDMESGINAKARYVVGINSGTHPSDSLIAAGASQVIRRATQLLTFVH